MDKRQLVQTAARQSSLTKRQLTEAVDIIIAVIADAMLVKIIAVVIIAGRTRFTAASCAVRRISSIVAGLTSAKRCFR